MTATFARRHLAALALAAAAALSAPLAAEAAGSVDARVAVPRVPVPGPAVPVPGGGGIAGCWSAQQRIYGPYAFSFCSNGSHGSYTVRGGGLYCNGSVNVTPGWGGAVTVRLSRSRCNGWTDWSADHLICRGGQWAGGPVGYGPVGYGRGGQTANGRVAQPRVPVPHVPTPSRRLDCTYFPVAAGYSPIGLALTRN